MSQSDDLKRQSNIPSDVSIDRYNSTLMGSTDKGVETPSVDHKPKIDSKDIIKAGVNAASGDYVGAAQVLKEGHDRNKDQSDKSKKNATKYDESDESDATDKALDSTDNQESSSPNISKNIRRTLIGAELTSKGVGFGGIVFLINKALMLMKAAMAMVMSAVSTVTSALVSGIVAIGSFLASSLGISTVVANVIVSGITTIATIGVVATSGVAIATTMPKDDGACIPTQTSVSTESQEYVASEGEFEKIREDYAIRLWSVFEALGASKMQAAAVLGNFQLESLRLDPTCVEGFYGDEHAYILSDAEAAEVAANNSDGGVGIGLAQWTWGRNLALQAYATTKGKDWYDFDTQVMFLLEGDNASDIEIFMEFLNRDVSSSNVDAETQWFLEKWERAGVAHLESRQTYARNYLLFLDTVTSDTNYANSILNSVNLENSKANESIGAYHQDDGCGDEILSHYGSSVADGTGVVPDDVDVNQLWTPATLPESLKTFYHNPEDLGIVYGGPTGWAYTGEYSGQCVCFSHTMFLKMYDTPTSYPLGNGKDIAQAWAARYGESITNTPSAGAVFSSYTSTYGHTGIVEHVFANGDMLVCEQNMYGYSGDNNGTPMTWSWRIVLAIEREGVLWEYFKPANVEPRWSTAS